MNLFLRDMMKGLMCAYLFENNILFASLRSNIQLRGDESYIIRYISNLIFLYPYIYCTCSVCEYVTTYYDLSMSECVFLKSIRIITFLIWACGLETWFNSEILSPQRVLIYSHCLEKPRIKSVPNSFKQKISTGRWSGVRDMNIFICDVSICVYSNC